MNKEVLLKVIEASCAITAMVLIWFLMKWALEIGRNGILFSIGVAAIAGLGGYELSQLIGRLKSKLRQGDKEKKDG